MFGFRSIKCLLVLFAICKCVNGVSEHEVLYGRRGDSLNLTCPIDLTPPIAWYKNNIPISPSDVTSSRFFSDGKVLYLGPSLKEAQAGWYTCAGYNVSRREERDLLVVVGDIPEIKFVNSSNVFTVLPNSRVELPCVIAGIPFPQREWRDGDDNPVTNSTNIQIIPVTGSLVINSYQSGSKYQCVVSNRFGERRSNITVTLTSTSAVPVLYDSPLNSISSELELASNSTYTLFCTGLSTSALTNANYSVVWGRSFSGVQLSENDDLPLNYSQTGPGLYCCTVSYSNNINTEIVSLQCVTVWARRMPSFMSTSLSSISLPTGSDRRAELLCITEQLDYDPPHVTWLVGDMAVNETKITRYSSDSVQFNFLRVPIDIPNITKMFTCTASNSGGSVLANVTVAAVDRCQGNNNIENGNAEGNTSSWIFSNSNASVRSDYNENVFVLAYTGVGTTIHQVLNVEGYGIANISGRIRQISGSGAHRGVAAFRISFDNNSFSLPNPLHMADGWQWVSKTFVIPPFVSAMKIELVVESSLSTISESALSGTAYFDDVCITMEANNDLIIIAGSVGGVVILILFLLVVMVCCCSIRRNKKTTRMKKMSINVGKRWTLRFQKQKQQDVISELKNSNFQNNVITDHAVNIETSAEYEPVDEQGPQIQFTTDPSNSETPQQLYTALDPQTVIKDSLYTSTTPISCRSISSLNDEASQEYDYITPSQTASYLQVIPSPIRTQFDLSAAVNQEKLYVNDEDLYENERQNFQPSPSPLQGDSRRSQSDLSAAAAVIQEEHIYINQDDLYENQLPKPPVTARM